MEWKRIRREEDVLAVLPYLRQSEIRFCDYSAGVRFMWREAYRVDYAIANDTLLMKETTDAYRDAFFCPIGPDREGALRAAEAYGKAAGALMFAYLDNAAVAEFAGRYPFLSVYNDRNWSDYLYGITSTSSGASIRKRFSARLRQGISPRCGKCSPPIGRKRGRWTRSSGRNASARKSCSPAMSAFRCRRAVSG